jgi:thiol:disulfide interchange protein
VGDPQAVAGAWISLETILLLRTTVRDRRLVTGLCSNVLALGYTSGSILAFALRRGGLPAVVVFMTVGAVAGVAAIHASLRLGRSIAPRAMPPPHATPHAGRALPALLWRIKTACVPALVYGYFTAPWCCTCRRSWSRRVGCRSTKRRCWSGCSRWGCCCA